MNNGTRNVGIRLTGNVTMSSVVTRPRLSTPSGPFEVQNPHHQGRQEIDEPERVPDEQPRPRHGSSSKAG